MAAQSRRRPASRWGGDANSDANVDDLPPGDKPDKRPHPDHVPGGEEVILLVEDQTEVRDSTRAILERLGYTVLVAADAEEAFREADGAEDIDLILADVILPSLNGLAVAERISEAFPEAAVLFMSGYTSDVVLPSPDEALRPHEFIPKPFTLEELARKVRAVLDG